MSAVAPLISSSPARANVALIQMEDEVADFLRPCLLQMGIEAIAVGPLADLAKRKFEGCVVDLRREDAEATLDAVRNSARNRRVVIFGVYSDPAQLRRFSRFGVNVVITWPAKKTDTLKVLRSTQSLLVNELRRYARVPLATEVDLVVHQEHFQGVSRELSGGGMSVTFTRFPQIKQSDFVEVTISVPPGLKLTLRGVICWQQPQDNLLGVQFLPDPEQVQPIRAWIDDYLGIR